MGDEQLIDLVRQYEAIYNVKCAEYRDVTERNAAWDKIAKLHGKSADECKEIWHKLRNCYNNAMKRRQKKSKDGKTIPPWRFEEEMSFLKPYLGLRNIAEYIDDNETDNVTIKSSPLPSPESISYVECAPSRADTPASNVSYKRKASNSNSNNYLTGMRDMIKTFQEIRQKELELDEVDMFFLSMSKMVKKLPKVDQIRIKMNLHKDVSEAELKQLEEVN